MQPGKAERGLLWKSGQLSGSERQPPGAPCRQEGEGLGGGAGGRRGQQEASPQVPLDAAIDLGLGSEAGDLLCDTEQESSTVMNCCFVFFSERSLWMSKKKSLEQEPLEAR